MQKIGLITSGRADYGILSDLIKRLQVKKKFKLYLIVTGSHLQKNTGLTINEIKQDKVKIYKSIYFKDSSYQENIKNILLKTSKLLKKIKPKILILLGDRYEIFTSALAAYIEKVPIAHIHGGEVTTGSMDDTFRNCITKMSYLHFAATIKSRKRILQLGENRNKVFNIGSLSLQNIKKLKLLNKKKFEKKYNVKLKNKIALICFHPDTLEKKFSLKNIKKIIYSLKNFTNYSLIFSGSNLDKGGKEITNFLKIYCKKNNYFFANSLGRKNFFSLLKLSNLIIGNSSSGIIEAPAFKTFTINIGQRQKGREQSQSIFNCDYDHQKFLKIFKKIDKIKNKNKYFKNYPYKEQNNAINKILKIIQKPISKRFNYKNFNDI